MSEPRILGDFTLEEVRRELTALASMAGSVERPKPTRINGPGSPMPGQDWDLHERTRPYGQRSFFWLVRVPDEQDVEGGLVFLSTPESMYPGDDFVPMYVDDVRRLALILLAAADRAEHIARGVVRLDDRRGPRGAQPDAAGEG